MELTYHWGYFKKLGAIFVDRNKSSGLTKIISKNYAKCIVGILFLHQKVHDPL